jgi:thiamine-monophosphate kinase
MKLRKLGERELVAAIRKDFSRPRNGLVLGIGDDAAVIQGRGGRFLLTTDLLIEDVHFITALHPARLLGRKALNVNISDIAAMGGRPRFALLGLALRPNLATDWVKQFFAGFKEAANECDVALVGGDISASKIIAVSVTLLGEGNRIIRRSGAKPGDLIYVSGSLGDAAAGFRLLRQGYKLGSNKKNAGLLRAFLDPAPQVALGLALSRRRMATSMIDTSDGLSVDLFHLCEESGTGAEIELRRLPLSPAIRYFETKPELLALHGGEDYQLLFSVDPKNSGRLSVLSKRFPIHRIGRMRRGKGLFLVDEKGQERPLEIKGFEHLS